MIAALPFGPGGLAFIALYLLSLLAIGWWGRRARQEDTLSHAFLDDSGIAGRLQEIQGDYSMKAAATA